MSTEYSNKDDLEEFYKKKFERYRIEPLPYAFDRINSSLGSSQTVYSKLKFLLVDKYRASLIFSVLLNVALVLWIWNIRTENTTNERSVQVVKTSKENFKVNSTESSEVVAKRPEGVTQNKNLPPKSLSNKNNAPTPEFRPLTETGIQQSNNQDTEIEVSILPATDSIKPNEQVEIRPQDFKSNLENYTQKKSKSLKDSARELFIPSK